jgi:hypothetical protein
MNSMVAPLLSAAAGFQSMSANTVAAGQEAARLADGAMTQQASVQQGPKFSRIEIHQDFFKRYGGLEALYDNLTDGKVEDGLRLRIMA